MSKRNNLELFTDLLGGPIAEGAGKVMGRLADLPAPQALLKPMMRLYSGVMGVESGVYEEPEEGFASFNGFFGRRLKPGEREICPDADALVSPCDGSLSAFGRLDENGTEFTIKRSRYSLASLLGSESDAASFKDGGFAVIYLHPRDYHRVHAPGDAALTATRHIPGTRYPVSGWCEALVDNIYDKNERMVFFFDLQNGEKIALVMVAAFGVGNIETPFHPGVERSAGAVKDKTFTPATRVAKGEEIGAFLLGSTVVLIGSRAAYSLDAGLETGPTKLGVRLGGMIPPGKTKP